MNDLLGDIRSANEVHVDLESGQPAAREGTSSSPSDEGIAMSRFYDSVAEVKSNLAELKGMQDEIKDMNETSKTLIKSKDVEKHRGDMQAKINQVNTLAHLTKRRIEQLDRDNEEAMEIEGCGPGSANERTRTAIASGFKKKLKDIMGEFSSLRTQFADEYRQVVEKRLRTITGAPVSEEDVERVIETGQADNLFQQAFATEQGRGRALDVLAEIQERNRAVRDLEQSLLELHQIFLDMSVLIEAQGVALDNIAKQVERGAAYVQSGSKNIVAAKNLQKNTRKWALVGVILVLVIAIIIILSLKPWTWAPAPSPGPSGNTNNPSVVPFATLYHPSPPLPISYPPPPPSPFPPPPPPFPPPPSPLPPLPSPPLPPPPSPPSPSPPSPFPPLPPPRRPPSPPLAPLPPPPPSPSPPGQSPA